MKHTITNYLSSLHPSKAREILIAFTYPSAHRFITWAQKKLEGGGGGGMQESTKIMRVLCWIDIDKWIEDLPKNALAGDGELKALRHCKQCSHEILFQKKSNVLAMDFYLHVLEEWESNRIKGTFLGSGLKRKAGNRISIWMYLKYRGKFSNSRQASLEYGLPKIDAGSMYLRIF